MRRFHLLLIDSSLNFILIFQFRHSPYNFCRYWQKPSSVSRASVPPIDEQDQDLQEDEIQEEQEEEETEHFESLLRQLVRDARGRGRAGRAGRRQQGSAEVRQDKMDELVQMFVNKGRLVPRRQHQQEANRQQRQVRADGDDPPTPPSPKVVPPPNFIPINDRIYLKNARLEINGDTKDQLHFNATPIDCSTEFVRMAYYQNLFFGPETNSISMVIIHRCQGFSVT